MINTSDFKTGLTIEYDNQIWQVMEFQHVKPGKGAAFVRTKLRNLRTRAVIDKTFRAGERMEKAIIEKQQTNYSYSMGDTYVFMDNDTYEQIEIEKGMLEEELNFLKEGMDVLITKYGHEIIGIQLPEKVTLLVVQADPGIKGNTAANATKNATVETGYELQVPLFVNEGDSVVINTATGKYDTRA